MTQVKRKADQIPGFRMVPDSRIKGRKIGEIIRGPLDPPVSLEELNLIAADKFPRTPRKKVQVSGTTSDDGTIVTVGHFPSKQGLQSLRRLESEVESSAQTGT